MRMLLLSFLFISVTVFGKAVIVEKHLDVNGIQIWTVVYFLNTDGSSSVIQYKSIEEAQKAIPVLDKSESGLSKDSDRVTIYLKEDESIDHIDYQIFPTVKTERGEQKIVSIADSETQMEISDLLTDVKSKDLVPQPNPK